MIGSVKKYCDAIIDESSFDKLQDGKYITTFPVKVFPGAADGGLPGALQDTLNRLKPGKHTMNIVVYGGRCDDDKNFRFSDCTQDPVAVTAFTLVVKEGKKAKTGVSFDELETAGMSDSTLEAKMVKLANGAAEDERWQQTFVKARIIDEDWSMIRHETSGELLGRGMWAWVYATWPDGHCSYQPLHFYQEYDGSTFQNKLGIEISIFTHGPKECDCIP